MAKIKEALESEEEIGYTRAVDGSTRAGSDCCMIGSSRVIRLLPGAW